MGRGSQWLGVFVAALLACSLAPSLSAPVANAAPCGAVDDGIALDIPSRLTAGRVWADYMLPSYTVSDAPASVTWESANPTRPISAPFAVPVDELW